MAGETGEAPPVPVREIEMRFVRSSGPGGQNVNKLNTKAVLRWPVATSRAIPAAMRQRFIAAYERRITATGDLVLTSDRFRDRTRNAADCVAKLQRMLGAVAAEPRERRATRPGRAARERRLEAKHRR